MDWHILLLMEKRNQVVRSNDAVYFYYRRRCILTWQRAFLGCARCSIAGTRSKGAFKETGSHLNVDPGTMSPYQHGEVHVTDDGAETDLDLGHYERYRCSGEMQ